MDKDSKMPLVNPPKKPAGMREEVKGALDARDLIGRFRSKADIYEYLSEHRKYNFYLIYYIPGQYYMPPIKKVTKDFLKEVFAGRKHLIPRA
jgi:hypothetical protein